MTLLVLDIFTQQVFLQVGIFECGKLVEDTLLDLILITDFCN